LPQRDPEKFLKLDDMYDLVCEDTLNLPTDTLRLGPFPNHSSFELGEWYIEAGSQLSLASLQNLVELAQRPGFSEQVSQANWPKIFNSLGGDGDVLSDPTGDANGDWIDEAGWKQTPVSIPVPIGGLAEAQVVGTLFHRSIVSILREKISNSPDTELFHFDPFEVHWQPDLESPPQRVYSELYNSDAFMKAHRELQDSPQPAGCHLPRVVVGLMFWSDSTHVSAFSSEKLWPLYMCFGNESKYRRCKTASELCHHVAYFDEVSTFPPIGCKLAESTTGRSFQQISRTTSPAVTKERCPQIPSWLTVEWRCFMPNGTSFKTTSYWMLWKMGS
jgi:hypothetical protein